MSELILNSGVLTGGRADPLACRRAGRRTSRRAGGRADGQTGGRAGGRAVEFHIHFFALSVSPSDLQGNFVEVTGQYTDVSSVQSWRLVVQAVKA